MGINHVSGKWTIPAPDFGGTITPKCFAMSATRFVIAANNPDYAAPSLVLTLVDATGAVITSTTLEGLNAYDLDGYLPPPLLCKVDATHLLDVADATRIVSFSPAFILQDAIRARRITVADSGFTVDYDLTTDAPTPARSNSEYPQFSVEDGNNCTMTSLEDGGMVFTQRGPWLAAIDPATGAPAWGLMEDPTGDGPTHWYTVGNGGLSLASGVLTAYWFAPLYTDDPARLTRSYTVNDFSATPIGVVASDPLADGLGALYHVNGDSALGITPSTLHTVGRRPSQPDVVDLDWTAGAERATNPMLPYVVAVSEPSEGGIAAAYWNGTYLSQLLVPGGTPDNLDDVHFTQGDARSGIAVGVEWNEGMTVQSFHGWIFSIAAETPIPVPSDLTGSFAGSVVRFF